MNAGMSSAELIGEIGGFVLFGISFYFPKSSTPES